MFRDDTHNIDDYITKQERENLLFRLHRFLVWVGEEIPDKVMVDGKYIKLNELIWRMIHKKNLSDDEKKAIHNIADILEEKEKHDEDVLKKASLTHKQAEELYKESAGLLRAIVDLKDIESGNMKLKIREHEIKQKINDSKRWMNFLKAVGKK